MHYLGHRISADHLESLPEKLNVIKNLAPTKNMDEACQILGLLGYYRSFIPAFGNITLPITNLLKRNTPFMWSKECQDTLNYLKEIFCNKPILQFPDPNKDYVLYKDASNDAYSGALCQLQSNTKILGQSHIFLVLLWHKQKLVCNQNGSIHSPEKHTKV